MVMGNKYVLYPRLADEGYFISLVVTFGKVPLTNSEINSSKINMKNDDNESNQVIDNLYKEI